jgi:hypothetical protein
MSMTVYPVRNLSVENHHLRQEVAELKRRLRCRELQLHEVEEELRKQREKASRLPVEY